MHLIEFLILFKFTVQLHPLISLSRGSTCYTRINPGVCYANLLLIVLTLSNWNVQHLISSFKFTFPLTSMNHYAIILVGFFILHLQHKKSLASVLSARCRSRCLAKVCTQRSANFPKCVMNLSVKSLTGCDLVTRVLRSLMLQVTKFCFELPIISASALFLILMLFFFFRGLSRVIVTAWKYIQQEIETHLNVSILVLLAAYDFLHALI